MNPRDYTGKEWTQLARGMTSRQLRNSLKRAYCAEAKKAVAIARQKLNASGMQVQGGKADWTKGIRSHIYSKGGGFLVTVRAHKAGKGKNEKSMHQNRYGFKKPVLMWAEEGTKSRKTKSNTKVFVRLKRGHKTGKMPAYGFLDKATPEMFQTVEADLGTEVGAAVEKVAKKCGFI